MSSPASALPSPQWMVEDETLQSTPPSEGHALPALQSPGTAAVADANTMRNRVLFDPALTFEEASRRWMGMQKKTHIIPDHLYDHMVLVLNDKLESDTMYKAWVAAGYFVRDDSGRLNLFQKERPKGVARPRKAIVKREDITSLCSSDEEERQASKLEPPTAPVTATPKTPGRIRRVPRMSEVVGFIHARHAELLHGGSKATYMHLEGEFVGIPRILVEAFVTRCAECLLKAQKKLSVYPIKAIHTKSFNQRCQMDLFDMQRTPGGPNKEYHYVLHYIDHATKFSVLTALKDKTAESVETAVFEIWMLLGPPDLLQSDNGTEFKNATMEALCLRYHVKHVFGRAYHPQTQGAVERANAFAKSKLVAWFQARAAVPDTDWLPGLKEVQYAMNSSWRRTIKVSPYKLVFNRDPTNGLGRHTHLEHSDEVQPLLDMLASSSEDEDNGHAEPDRPEQEEEKEGPGAEDVDMTSAEVPPSHTAVQQAAEAASAAYSRHMEDLHNTRPNVPTYKAGDLVIMKLRKKGLTALQPKRKIMMIFRVSELRGTANLYCGHGYVAGAIPFADLQPCPEELRTEEFNWDWQELASRRRQHVSQNTLPSVQFNLDEIARMDAGLTATPKDPTSTQLMQRKKRASSAKLQLAVKRAKVPVRPASRKASRPSGLTAAGLKIVKSRAAAKKNASASANAQ